MIHCQVNIAKKQFSNEVVIENLKFDLEQGEFLTIVGPSGVGKSTLLNLIGHLDNNFIGTIKFNESDPEFKNIAYVFQEARLMPWLTVANNIDIVLPKSIAKQEREKMVLDVLSQMQLVDYRSAYPHELSGGMQRRVAIARALVIKPGLLLMDEPFVSLDKPTAESLRKYLLDIWQKSGVSIVFITHDINEAIYLSDRILFLSKKPSRVLHELNIDPVQSGNREDRDVNTIQRQLQNEYPDLLEGSINQKNEEVQKDVKIKAIS